MRVCRGRKVCVVGRVVNLALRFLYSQQITRSRPSNGMPFVLRIPEHAVCCNTGTRNGQTVCCGVEHRLTGTMYSHQTSSFFQSYLLPVKKNSHGCQLRHHCPLLTDGGRVCVILYIFFFLCSGNSRRNWSQIVDRLSAPVKPLSVCSSVFFL